MKNRIANRLITGIMTAALLCGCSKSADDSGNTLTNETPSDISVNQDGGNNGQTTSVETGDQPATLSEQERIDSFQLIAPMEEIKNSAFSDRIFQVQDVLVPTDGSMTVGELVEKVREAYDFRLIIEVGQNEELTPEHMTEKADSLIFCDDLWGDCGQTMFTVYYDPALIDGYDNASIAVWDCPIAEVYAYRDTVYALNMFESGNLCDGLFTISDDIIASAAYQERLKEYPECTDHTAFMAYLDSKGAECVEYKESNGSDHAINVVGYDNSMEIKNQGMDCYRAKQYRLFYYGDTDKFTNLEKIDTFIKISDIGSQE
jgi:hypothetical protein